MQGRGSNPKAQSSEGGNSGSGGHFARRGFSSFAKDGTVLAGGAQHGLKREEEIKMFANSLGGVFEDAYSWAPSLLSLIAQSGVGPEMCIHDKPQRISPWLVRGLTRNWLKMRLPYCTHRSHC